MKSIVSKIGMVCAVLYKQYAQTVFKHSHKGWSQNRVHSKFVQFDSKICDSIDSKGQKILEKFDEN